MPSVADGPAAFRVALRLDERDWSTWLLVERDWALTGALVGVEPLIDGWIPRPVRWQFPNVPKPDVMFYLSQIVLHDETGDETLRELLNPWGEWLPLGGEGAGYSLWHCTHATPINEAESRRTMGTGGPDVAKGTVDVLVVDDGAWTPESVTKLGKVGLVWFEGDAREPSGLRAHLLESGLTGIGLYKCWDQTGTFVHEPLVTLAKGEELRWE